MFLLNRQAENPCLPFPVHTTFILAHRGLETQSQLTEHHRWICDAWVRLTGTASASRPFRRG